MNEWSETVHALAIEKGWYDCESCDGLPMAHGGCAACGNRGQFRNMGELIALIHSELSEALEVLRDDGPPSDFAEEVADVIIRTLDMCAYVGIDIDAAVTRKHSINQVRARRHGKKF